MSELGASLERLVGIMKALRAPDGCPWDKEQTLKTLRPYLIEEAFEVLDEMDRVSAGGSWKPYAEELGDLLFQIVFHAQLASEKGEFSMTDVCNAISDKIERRHPHVFGTQAADTSTQVLQNWAKLKADERKAKHGRAGSVLDGVPTGAPALLRAERLTEKASRIGFDWPDLTGVRAKLDEELRELDEAIAEGDRAHIEHELGDVLFSVANLSRHLATPAEDALRAASARFTRRFHGVEARLERDQVPFGEAPLAQLDRYWNEAKAEEQAGTDHGKPLDPTLQGR
jgi:ATP diphosphatase